MGVCNWETLHIPRAAFMEDLYTMISKYLTKPPVYTRTISTIRIKSPFIDLQIEREKMLVYLLFIKIIAESN